MTAKIQWPDDLEPDSRCPLNPHKGKEMKDVPVHFLKWAYAKAKNTDELTSVPLYLVSRYYQKHHLTVNGILKCVDEFIKEKNPLNL